MRIADKMRVFAALLTTALPWLERDLQVLPVSGTARETAWLAATLATLLCVIAGYATARHSFEGFRLGWVSLVLFLAVVVAMFAVMDLIPRSDRALYIMCFAFAGLSAASFLSLRREEGWSEATSPQRSQGPGRREQYSDKPEWR